MSKVKWTAADQNHCCIDSHCGRWLLQAYRDPNWKVKAWDVFDNNIPPQCPSGVRYLDDRIANFRLLKEAKDYVESLLEEEANG